jgi:hypothetical protein
MLHNINSITSKDHATAAQRMRHIKYQNLLDTHAEAVKAHTKAPDGYKTGHERAVRNAMTALLKAENNG